MSVCILQLEHSPYCIPITRALEALGVAFDVRNVSNADRREVIEATAGAYYQVPVLVHDGRAVFETSGESNDVARYVDRTFANGSLFPAAHEGIQRIVVPYIEDRVESVTFRLVDPSYLRDLSDPVERTMIRRHKERKFGAGCIEAWDASRDDLLREAESLLKPFDLILENSLFLFGEAPVFSDFALFGILGNLTYRDYNEVPPSLVRIKEWRERMAQWTFRR
ncbi:MAG: glutathione S-transferase N-terminal domain-containing protein [Terrimicrobiaceae bacterium]|nr:glutathione S-transferase N-terminal domain-containing protein [Terrimicrobiaceae bacterium]